MILLWSCSPETPSQTQLTLEPLGCFDTWGELLLSLVWGSCVAPTAGSTEQHTQGIQGSSALSLIFSSFLVKNFIKSNNVKTDEVLVPATHSPWTELLCKNLKPGSDASRRDITEISTSAAGTQQNMLLLLEKY